MSKKAWCTCKVVVLLNKPIAVLTFSLPLPLPSPLSLLKLPIDSDAALTRGKGTAPRILLFFSIVLLSPVQTDASWPTPALGCYMLRPLVHHVVCCCMSLRVVGVVTQSLKPVKPLSQQLLTFLLFRDRRHMVSKLLWVVSSLRCTAGPTIVGSCCIRLHTIATDGRNNSQHCWPNNI